MKLRKTRCYVPFLPRHTVRPPSIGGGGVLSTVLLRMSVFTPHRRVALHLFTKSKTLTYSCWRRATSNPIAVHIDKNKKSLKVEGLTMQTNRLYSQSAECHRAAESPRAHNYSIPLLYSIVLYNSNPNPIARHDSGVPTFRIWHPL